MVKISILFMQRKKSIIFCCRPGGKISNYCCRKKNHFLLQVVISKIFLMQGEYSKKFCSRVDILNFLVGIKIFCLRKKWKNCYSRLFFLIFLIRLKNPTITKFLAWGVELNSKFSVFSLKVVFLLKKWFFAKTWPTDTIFLRMDIF